MTPKKLLCFCLSLICVFMFCSCKKQGEANTSSESITAPVETVGDKTAQLLCCYSDSFNPYTAKTAINRSLCKLIYEPLIKCDNNFEPIYCLAQSAVIEGNVCTVTLKPLMFSDGSAVTADDVVYSYNLARSSSTIYASQLYEVSSAKGQGSGTVVFNLSRHDPYFINLLDFPILKAGSEKVVDADGVIQPPVGCGRFSVAKEQTSLIRNDAFFGSKAQISLINLIDAPDSESVSHHVEVGATDLYYTDISDGNIVRMSAKKTDVNLNSLVYIGINASYGALANRETRYAISAAIDRSEICQSAYYNNALAATGFFTPVFKASSPTQTLNKKSNFEISIENLDKIGYNSVNSAGLRTNYHGNKLSFTLLVNTENRSRVMAANLIASKLGAVGIEIKVIERPYQQYIEALSQNNFQLYLGEINILPNMDISPLVVPGGSAAYGVVDTKAVLNTDAADVSQDTAAEDTVSAMKTADILNSFYSGNSSINDVAGFLLTEMPQIPVCYRKGLLFYDSDIVSGVESSQSDIYLSIQDYKYKK